MIINHNINAMMAWRYSMINGALAGKAMQRLSSGLRINSAADDPAGLAISEKMRGQIRGLQVASRNAQDGISMIQVQDGALNETQSILQRIRELTVQASNGTNTEEDRKKIQEEINELTNGIDDIANNTEFNTMKLLNNDNPKEIKLQVGANQGQAYGIEFQDMRSKALNLSNETGEKKLDVSTPESASDAIKKVDEAIDKVSSFRASLGAKQNVLEHRINYLQNSEENLTLAESRIRDADIAKEIMNFTKYSVLQQVAQAMLAQTKGQGESIIQLLKSL